MRISDWSSDVCSSDLYERGEQIDPDKYEKKLAKLQKRLGRIQVSHILHKRRAIVVLEGWDAAGKGGIIRRATAQMDPRYFEVWPTSAPTPEEKYRHYLWRSEEHTSELQSLMRISYAVFC